MAKRVIGIRRSVVPLTAALRSSPANIVEPTPLVNDAQPVEDIGSGTGEPHAE